MPTYMVQAPNGKTIEIDGPAPPSEAVLNAIFSKMDTRTEAPPEPKGAVSRFVGNFVDMVNPVTAVRGLANAAIHPLDTGRAILDQQGKLFDRAVDDARKGRYSEAIGRGVASLVPMVGPVVSDVADQVVAGDYAGAAGKFAGLVGGGVFTKAALKGAGRVASRAPMVTREAELARFGLKNRVPVDAATASASPVPRAVQKLSGHSFGGGAINARAAAAREQGLATLGEQLAAKAAKTPQTLETAGQSVREGVEQSIRGFDDAANTHYGRIREIAERPASAREVRVTERLVPSGASMEPAPTQAMQAPVDLRLAREALMPLHLRMQDKLRRVGSLQGSEARAADAIGRLVEGDDFGSIMDVDAALGEIKSMARGAEMPELRTSGQGAAAQAVKQIDRAVMQAADDLGPEAVAALKAGRLATRQKYAAAEVLNAIKAEPVRTAKAAIAPSDAAVRHLEDLQQFAPESLPAVGRAVLSDMMSTATATGGFRNARTLATQWNKMGPRTKALLFQDPAYVRDLDKFWALTEKMADNPNPSGSGYIFGLGAQGAGLVFNPVAGAAYQVGWAGLSKLLNSPKITRALVEGWRFPVKGAAGVARSNRLFNLIDQATKSSAANPATQPAPSRTP